MMKTFCDNCDEEIPHPHGLECGRLDEFVKGRAEKSSDLCARCLIVARTALRELRDGLRKTGNLGKKGAR